MGSISEFIERNFRHFNAAHRFLFRNASISDAIEVPPQELLLLLRT